MPVPGPQNKAILLAWPFWVWILLASNLGNAADHGVILLYHHVSSETPGVTSVTPEQFDDHLNYLADNDFEVMPLIEMLDLIYTGQPVPDNAVAITFDDAYISVYEEAFPRLKKRGWPFTLYVSDDPVDRGFNQFMTWDQIREMAETGAEIGGHSTSHAHMIRDVPGETPQQWEARIIEEIDSNAARIKSKLGIDIQSFAYPYGEYTEAITQMIEERGYYGLAQQSGAVARNISPQTIPRFPMMQGYHDQSRLATALNSQALPVVITDSLPSVLTAGDTPGTMQFRLTEGSYQARYLACYGGPTGILEIEVSAPNYRVALPNFSAGRNKINCTAPSSEKSGDFFWFSRQWVVKHADGSWPRE